MLPPRAGSVRLSTSVSVVINTYNRCESLRKTIEGLRGLDYTDVEVVIVNGPSTDGTADFLATLDDVVVADCPARNLSWSRNVGIRAARGDVVAFIDDDAYPDPSWLTDLVRAFADPEVGGAGGPVWDYTGGRLQLRYSVVNRFGDPRILFDANPTQVSNHPRAEWFAHTIGTNSAFRRAALVGIGGFDEEFEYYLDETDVCCRLVNAGWVVAELEDGFVYHKFLPSDVRGSDRVIRNRWPIVKNRCYFALKHGAAWSSFGDAAASITEFLRSQREEVAHHVASGALSAAEGDAFDADVHDASNRALIQYAAGADRSRPPSWFATDEGDLRRFRTHGSSPDRMHVVYFAADYPPNVVYGISRVVHSLATGMAARGHVVRVMVLSPAEPHLRVDLEDGVWVHRLPWADDGPPAPADVPERIWRTSWLLHAELLRMDAHRPVDVLQTPNWDSLAVATQRSAFRGLTVIGLYTPLGVAAGMTAAIKPEDPEIQQMLRLEPSHYGRADGLLACGPAVVDEIEAAYVGLALSRERIGYVPHGLVDRASCHRPEPSARRMLYVGRLEGRKGIDVLLKALPEVLAAVPDVRVDIVGEDPGGVAEAWTATTGGAFAAAVTFHGQVSDEALEVFYRETGLLVIPSRFESFGLPIVEAAMWSRPSVACAVGGMPELIEEGQTGLLVPVGDAVALERALVEILVDDQRRDAMGRAARQRFLAHHEQERMARSVDEFYRSLLQAARTN